MAFPPHPLILIVEDEPAIASLLEAYLKRDGFRTDVAGTGTRALTLHRANRPELVLLDVNLPDIDGFEVLRRIRDQSGSLGQTPVILVTAMAEDLEKLLGLRLGADDYVVKPFGPLEVVARVKAVLRRTLAAGPLPAVFRLGALEVDPVGMVARVHGQRLELTLSEYRLLEHLARHPNRTFARSELFAACLPESEALERVVDAHLGNVRKKLDQAGLPGLLETVRGVGYRLWVP
ncbi:response regulator transcription factor [Deinococcus sp. Arct2-2]|uniref:response regulator transcription factor n=1 Tax=Deinococcus sp. Arct2-2 TaxID=2568653 RepID=UPI0010A4D28D|nr:response regulator transcription factor [Deinococcus sp. Arct2-2]THF67720.1 response regulator transcription factor [Deinococcus sp. Arct2-2]